jgi:NSS family neurotransmitter:Na+ symporter
VKQDRAGTLWGTRFGFYLAAVGSAFGLGNLWRFPYVTVENGGGGFVFLYIMMAVLIGLPLLVAELMLGKLSRRSSVAAFARLNRDHIGSANRAKGPSSWVWVGRLSLFVCVLVFSYYAVVSGWVLFYLGEVLRVSVTGQPFDSGAALSRLQQGFGLQLIFVFAHLVILTALVYRGVQQGIERWVGNVMPAFLILLVVLVYQSLNLPTAAEGLRFMLYPDFRNITLGSPLAAIGHVCFTLSIGVGTMITFGSYLKDETHIPSAGFRVTTIDTLISLFAGLLVFPMMMSISHSGNGPELLFSTLPRLLFEIDRSVLLGFAFFLCLYFAALGASLGMFETMVANLLDITRLNRRQATAVVGLVALGLALIPILTHTRGAGRLVFGRPPLEALDALLINLMMPLVAMGTALALSRSLKQTRVEEEFINDESQATRKLFRHWQWSVSYLIPTVILGSFVLAAWGWFKSIA